MGPVMVVVDDANNVITHQVIVAEVLMSDLCECPVEEEREVCFQLGNGTTPSDLFVGFVCLNSTETGLVVDFDVREDYLLLNSAFWTGEPTDEAFQDMLSGGFTEEHHLADLNAMTHSMEVSVNWAELCED